MYAKLHISGEIELLSGLHIGDGGQSTWLKPADQSVVRSIQTGEPIIPATTLKGKLRTLLCRALRHGLLVNSPENDPEEVCRLFGAPGRPGRLLFRDAMLINADAFINQIYTEIKMETAIDRASGRAVPRSVERVLPGARFSFSVIYDATEPDEAGTDLQNLAGAMELLAMDALGGHGSRGSGRVAFRNMKVALVYGGGFDQKDLALLNGVFQDAALNL